MYCVRKVTDDLYWVGANDHRLHLFENIHPIPRGVSYNAYLLLDEQSVLFDTVDWSAYRSSRITWTTCWATSPWTGWWSTTWSPTTEPAWSRSSAATPR